MNSCDGLDPMRMYVVEHPLSWDSAACCAAVRLYRIPHQSMQRPRVCRSENEKNRRRDLVTALRNRRDQMLLSLKREHGGQERCAS